MITKNTLPTPLGFPTSSFTAISAPAFFYKFKLSAGAADEP